MGCVLFSPPAPSPARASRVERRTASLGRALLSRAAATLPTLLLATLLVVTRLAAAPGDALALQPDPDAVRGFPDSPGSVSEFPHCVPAWFRRRQVFLYVPVYRFFPVFRRAAF
jgi:hypothetical protein